MANEETHRGPGQRGCAPNHHARMASVKTAGSIKLFHDALQGVRTLHFNGWLHGDLKSSNIGINGDWAVTLDNGGTSRFHPGVWCLQLQAMAAQYCISHQSVKRKAPAVRLTFSACRRAEIPLSPGHISPFTDAEKEAGPYKGSRVSMTRSFADWLSSA
jgi:serine/threonine protein kinase